MFGEILQPTHLLLILLVALLVLGPKRLPEVGRSLGKGLRDFRGAMAGIEEHTSNLLGDDDPAEASESSATSVPEKPADVAKEAPAAVETGSATAVGASPTGAASRGVSGSNAHEPDPSEYAD